MAAKQILLDGKVLEGTDMYGEWGVHTFEGWWDSPDVKTEQTERPGADGDFDLPVYYQARYPTLTGIFIAESESKMFDGMNRFSAMLRNPGRLQVVGYGPTQWANVRRTSGLVITPQTDRVCLWQAKAKAPDPRKYGRAADFVRSNGTVSVSHRGNYDARPTIVVRGSAPGGYRINGPSGKQYKVTRALVTGVPHRIEFSDGLLRVDGNLVPTGIESADVWPVPPGAPTVFDINTNSGGTAEATITVTDTYI